MINFLYFLSLLISASTSSLVITTFNTSLHQHATQTAFKALQEGSVRVAALVEGLTTWERRQADRFTTLPPNIFCPLLMDGRPAETRMDALLMDSRNQQTGAVIQLREARDAASVAWAVMKDENYEMLFGKAARRFAVSQGISTSAPDLRNEIDGCKNPDNNSAGMIVVDETGIAAGIMSNGADDLLPDLFNGTVIPGAGAYVDEDTGAAVAIGEANEARRFMLSYQTVEFMKLGTRPGKAARKALVRICEKKNTCSGMIIAVNKKGVHNAFCFGDGKSHFVYSFMDGSSDEIQKKMVQCAKWTPSK